MNKSVPPKEFDWSELSCKVYTRNHKVYYDRIINNTYVLFLCKTFVVPIGNIKFSKDVKFILCVHETSIMGCWVS